jgi:peptide/nickel transport system ATP-binding protein
VTVALLEGQGLTKEYPGPARGWARPRGRIRAVEGVDLRLEAGRTLGLVGESGAGKSTLARLLVRLEQPTAGRVLFRGEDLLALDGEALRRRRREIQMVFQDARGALNPAMTVGQALAEPLRAHGLARNGRSERVAELLESVGLTAAMSERRPGELSGGERQRVGIARALATDPAVLVADEPVSALDVSIRAQIVNLFATLQDRLGLGLLFIAHDLAAVEQIAHRVAILYQGRVVEEGPTGEVFGSPRHPYTAALLEAVPRLPAPSGL